MYMTSDIARLTHTSYRSSHQWLVSTLIYIEMTDSRPSTRHPEKCKTKKHICKTFKGHGLSLIIEANKKRVNFLDVTLDLNTSAYKPYNKLGNVIQYVNRQSNHPSSVLRSIPESIKKRLSRISSDKRAFDSAIPPYQEALKKSGYDYKLNYNQKYKSSCSPSWKPTGKNL